MEPLTEHRDVSDLVVYGFLRLVRTSAARQAALSASLIEYCRQHELLLSGVFTERAPYLTSAAFVGLLDVLALPGTYGVVLPAASHLGPKAIAAQRRQQIETSGARLLLVRGASTPEASGRSASRSPGSGYRRRRSPGPAPALDAET
ncbi:hypothetical protein [Planomonospora venezuelensis]|uniref:Uncharacterized protein n=1 Tax=Planomonospora venezuelensis TaxID=1999 RepID=A0A841DC18_PLAVE|nr:hypothetical protein [Planomonospora venezuelensis]MBB5964906.1 hypothetical protein [Planomonospora venezuelensis]GIM99494.1 hypothetical protein Pve01_11530 [Planomonospora venezuelensis]